MPIQPQQWLAEFNPAIRSDGDQFDTRITQLKNGNVLVAWTTESQEASGSPDGLDIIGRIFSPLGEPVSGEFRLNKEFSNRDERAVEIAALEDGGFLAIYHDEDPLNVPLLMDRFDARGNEVSSMAGFGSASDNNIDHAVAVSSDTSVMVAYHEAGEIKGQIYSPYEDFPTTGEFTIAKSTGGPITDVALTTLKSGNYAMTAVYTNSNGPTIVHKVMLPDGTTRSSLAFTGNTQLNGRANFDPSITALEDGGFAIAWRSTEDGDRTIFVQRHTATGSKLGEVIDVSEGSNASFDGHDPQITSTNDGGFVVVFRSIVDKAILARAFDKDGDAVGNVVTVTEGATMRDPRVETLDDGRIAITWTDVSAGNDVGVAIIDPRTEGEAAYGEDPAVPKTYVGTPGDDTANTGDAKFIHMHDGDDVIRMTGSFDGPRPDIYDGGKGFDTLKFIEGGEYLRYYTDYRSIESIEFSDNPNDEIVAFFRDHQFGDGGLSERLHVDGGAAKKSAIYIFMDDPDLFNLSKWTFENWKDGEDRLVIQGTVDDDTVRGSDHDDAISLGSGDDRTNGNDGDDTLSGGEGKDTLNGSKGDDFIVGGDDADRLNGGAGNDTIRGDEGNDRIDANSGDDSVDGGDGEDLIFGQNDEDTLNGNDGNDTLSGGNQADSVTGGNGNDDISGDNGNDTLRGNGGDDKLEGGNGVDKMYGGAGDDTLKGEDNDDFLDGGGGADRLVGGSGDDTLDGGAGIDILIGGLGDDVFVFEDVSESKPSQQDTITDFEIGSDVIFLAGIDADRSEFGDQAFTFIGDDAFTGAGQVRAVETSQGMRILGRIDDNSSNDLRIDLDGVFGTLSADDFIL